jgi:L-alanine-DL-glutamate epimerase-like enolase superfamily enzyme
MAMIESPRITDLHTTVYRVPTDRAEADGTIAWDSTTMVVVHLASNAGRTGLGWSYASAAAATVIHDTLYDVVVGCAVDDLREIWRAMVARVRNVGRQGIAATAISAVDIALWDLKAKCQNMPLFRALGAAREQVPIYGSGGFTTYTDQDLEEQLGGWAAQGIPRVKMKIGTDWGTHPELDMHRVEVARRAIGNAELFVDANGAYSAKQAIGLAHEFQNFAVTYFEEPVSSDQLGQLAHIRQRISQDVAAGEYGYDPWYFSAMLDAAAVDILQADATRCLGMTGWLEAAALAHSAGIPFSAHCGPSIHAQAACAAPQIEHIEYFYDHVRIEHMLFDGVLNPVGGCLRPDPSRPGLGLELKRADAARYAVC